MPGEQALHNIQTLFAWTDGISLLVIHVGLKIYQVIKTLFYIQPVPQYYCAKFHQGCNQKTEKEGRE